MTTHVLMPSIPLANDFVDNIQQLCVGIKEIIRQIPDTHPHFVSINKLGEQIYVATKPINMTELIGKINALSAGIYYVRDFITEGSLFEQIKAIDIALFQLAWDIKITAPMSTINSMYKSAIPTCSLTYKIYIDLIMQNGIDMALLNRMKDHTICVSGDPIDEVKPYHSIQLMTYTPNSFSASTVADIPDEDVVDIRFTQSPLAYIYDVRRLTTKKHAIEYGPILTSTTGINYKLVQRMNTVQSTPMDKSVKQNRRDISIDGIAHVDIGQPSTLQVHQSGVWGILGGSHPRVSRFNMVESEIIMQSVREARHLWPINIGRSFNEVERPADLCNDNKVADLMIREIFAIYDLRPAMNYAEFYSMVFGDDGFHVDNYICNVMSNIGFAFSSARLSTATVRNPMWNGATPDVTRETALSQYRQAIAAGKELYRRIKLIYRCDSSVFALPEIQRRYKLVTLMKRIIISAVNSEPLVCSELTIAEYAATRRN